MLVWVAVAAAVLGGQPEGRQADFAGAARAYGVPESVLLGVSYLHSRWDAHGGEPSTAGGYGPMHLLGAAPPVPLTGATDGHGGGHADGHADGDARGDDARPMRHRFAPAPGRAPAPRHPARFPERREGPRYGRRRG